MGQEVQLARKGTEEVALTPAEVGQMSAQDKMMAVALEVHRQYHIIRVNNIGEYYWRTDADQVYHSLDSHLLSNWVRDAWLSAFGGITPKHLADGVEMVRILTKEEVSDLSLDCIMVSNNLFWDRERGEVSDHATSPVFYRLFDTTTETKHVVKIPDFTPKQEEIFLKRYRQVKKELENGEEIERYDFVKTWADGSHDVYMDLIRSHAYMFLKKKPLGAYILIGLKRNGKSSFIGLTHSIMGDNNTSNVQLSQLGDPHITHMLRHSMMNAPDEEDDKAIKAQAFFKSMADHGTLSLPVMRSNVPVRLDCDFMCFFPMNHTPEWTGSGAAACMDRSLIIPFNADLSHFDKQSGNFAKETFTGDMMADYLGTVFAYAWWYHRHDFDFSETMKTEQGVLEQDLDSCLTYYKRFITYFDGFESFKTIYQDYQYWCQAQEVKINSRKELKFVFRAIANSKTSYRKNGTVKMMYRLPQPGKQVLFEEFHPKETESLKVLHEKACSIVDRLDVYYESKRAEAEHKAKKGEELWG